jgi:hypothetical protein
MMLTDMMAGMVGSKLHAAKKLHAGKHLQSTYSISFIFCLQVKLKPATTKTYHSNMILSNLNLNCSAIRSTLLPKKS